MEHAIGSIVTLPDGRRAEVVEFDHPYCGECVYHVTPRWSIKPHRPQEHHLQGGKGLMAEWRDVPFWRNYVVSDEGEVARKDTGRILKTYPQKSGYVYVWLSRGNGRKAVPLHRVVAMAFHGTEGYKQGMFVDHIDTNRANNRADNLHWVTPKENMNNPNTLSKRKKHKEIKEE